MKRLVLGAIALASACGGGEAPTIASFTADKAMVGLGDRVNLSWDVSGATSIGIVAQPGGVLIEGSDALQSTAMSGPITASTHFVLTASNGDQKATADVTVTVDASVLRITRFRATPAEIEPGATATLDWTIAGSPIGKVKLLDAAGATLFEGTAATGMKDVTPAASATYRLEVSNIAQSITATTGVVVMELPPSISSFAATPNPAPTGTRGTLNWQTVRADEVQISRDGTVIRPWNANGAAMGFTSFTFDMPTSVFKLEARNGFGTVQQEVTVQTLPRPVIDTFEVTPQRFTTATATVGIRWSVRDADTVALTVGGAVPAGFTGQAMGNITIPFSRTASVVLVGHSSVGDVMDTKTVRKVVVFIQDVVSEGGAIEGAAVRVEDASGLRFFEGVTDSNGRASIDIDADMTLVSVSAAKAGFAAMAFVGVRSNGTPLRLDTLPLAGPMPPPPAAIEGTFFNKSSLDAEIVVSGDDFTQVDTTGITYMSDYQVTNAPLTLIALDFGIDGVVVNATVTAPITRTGAMISQGITFSRPGPMPVTTTVDLVLPTSGIFPAPGDQFQSNYLPALRQAPDRDDFGVLVGWGGLAETPGHLTWTVTSFNEPGLAPNVAYVAANGQSLQLLAANRRFGGTPTVEILPVGALDFSPDGTRLLDARIDFDAPSYDALEADFGDTASSPRYRVFFIGQTRQARVPRLPSTVHLRDIGVGLVGTLPVVFSLPVLDTLEPWEVPPSVRPPLALEYALRTPIVEYGVMGF